MSVVSHRVQQLEAQGQLLVGSDSPQYQEVASALRLLGHQSQQLKTLWEMRRQKLQEGLQLQRFGQEVDGFIVTCASHEALLHPDNLGVKSRTECHPTVPSGSWVQKSGWAGTGPKHELI